MIKFLPLLLLVACTPKDEEFQQYVELHHCAITNDGVTAVCNDPFYRWIAPRD